MSRQKTAMLKPGTVLEDKWIIMELIGKGAMGEVYRAHQTNLKRDVAIKIISEDVMSEIEGDPEELDIAYGRFQREVQTMAQVRHPNILTIYDYGEINHADDFYKKRIAYIVMEYIPGNSLRFTLSEDGLDDVPDQYDTWIRNYFLPVLDGVEILHNNKIVHRDLKPENIFMDGDAPKIADFGLARSHHIQAVTTSIEMLGTLAYMSPEQCSDFKTADYTTDIYALGKILFEAIHGTLTEKVVPFTNVFLDNPQTDFLVEMSVIIQKATAEKPEMRYQTIQELKSDLQKALLEHKIAIDQDQKSQIVASSVNTITKYHFTWIIVGVLIAILSVGYIGNYHLNKKQKSLVRLDESPYSDHADLSTDRQIISAESNGKLAPSITGRDGSRMILTGMVENRMDGPFLFYMDEQKITNFLFIEFLNLLREKLAVKNGVVRHGETIIIYIGDGAAEEDVIVFQHERFHLKDQNNGSKPVVRVTYHGAHMFAATYGKDLLTGKEWRYAYRYHAENTGLIDDSALQHENRVPINMMHGTGIPRNKEDAQSVLDNMGLILKEWVRITQITPGRQTATPDGEVYDSGIMDAERISERVQPLKRFPWEGFDDVGFRTKIPVLREKKAS